MTILLTRALLWFCAIGCSLLAGVYFAFSTFVMTALARTGPAAGIASMNAINVVIVRSLFMPFFLGTTLASAALAVIGLFDWRAPGAAAAVTAGVVYVLGMFVVTLVFNVPLNNALAAVDPSSAGGASLWARYTTEWTVWNHARTVASAISGALFMVALGAR